MRKSGFQLWILATDLLWVATAFLSADVVRYGMHWGQAQENFAHDLMPSLLLWALISSMVGLDGFRGGWHFPAMVSTLFLAVSFMMMALLAASYISRRYASRLALGYFGVLLLFGFVAVRYGAYLLLRTRHRAGKVDRVVVVGNGQVAREVAAKIERHPEMLTTVVGFLYPQDTPGSLKMRTPEYGRTTLSSVEVVELLHGAQVDELILALEKPSWPELLSLVGRCRGQGINVSLIPQPYELYLSKPDLLDLGGLPLLRLRESAASNRFFRWKRVMDLTITLLLAIVAIPLLFFAAALLRFSKRQAFRWEVRSGKNGHTFPMLRLNVDRHAANLTSVERLLQELSITELPQLLNVLRGEMSLVGPRPESPDRVRHYSEWEQQRLSVHPGITGLAQVHGLREQHSSEAKTRFDLQYLLHPTPLADFSLLLQTGWTLVVRIFRRPTSSFYRTTTGTEESRSVTDLRYQSMGEALQDAHRSQPSAD
jgi:lipopolysaccharide/colanic/teichoic acid biosynthesis glycosyltransferase